MYFLDDAFPLDRRWRASLLRFKLTRTIEYTASTPVDIDMFTVAGVKQFSCPHYSLGGCSFMVATVLVGNKFALSTGIEKELVLFIPAGQSTFSRGSTSGQECHMLWCVRAIVDGCDAKAM